MGGGAQKRKTGKRVQFWMHEGCVVGDHCAREGRRRLTCRCQHIIQRAAPAPRGLLLRCQA